MSEKIQEVNVEEIMKEIQEDVKNKKMKDNIPDFSDIDASPIIDDTDDDKVNVELIKDYSECAKLIGEYKHLEFFENYQGSKLAVIIKKVIRKVMKFLIYPMVERQNLLNSLVAKEFELMDDGAGMNKQQIEQYFINQEKLVEKLESQVMLLQNRVEELERQLEDK